MYWIKKGICAVAALVASLDSFAQSHYAGLDKAPQEGYYKIIPSASFIGYSKAELADLRLKDESGKDVAYLLRSYNDTPVKTRSFVNFELTKTSDASKTVLLINKQQYSGNELVVKLHNANVEKRFSVQGSKDKNHWFALQAQATVNPYFLPGDSVKEMTLNLPANNYPFLKLTVADSLSEKLFFTEAGFYNESLSTSEWQILPNPEVKKFVSAVNKESRFMFSFSQPYKVDALELTFGGDYYRNATLYSIEKGKKLFLQSLTISTDNQNIFRLDHLWTDSLELVVYDKDNAALTLKSIKATQLPLAVFAYLLPVHTYSVYIGNDTLKTPQYDLVHFEDKLNNALPELKTGTPLVYEIKPSEKAEASVWDNPILIWVGIGLIVLLLGGMSYRMIKDMNSKTA